MQGRPTRWDTRILNEPQPATCGRLLVSTWWIFIVCCMLYVPGLHHPSSAHRRATWGPCSGGWPCCVAPSTRVAQWLKQFIRHKFSLWRRGFDSHQDYLCHFVPLKDKKKIVCFSLLFFFQSWGVHSGSFWFFTDIFPDVPDFWSFCSSFQAKCQSKCWYAGPLDSMCTAMFSSAL